MAVDNNVWRFFSYLILLLLSSQDGFELLMKTSPHVVVIAFAQDFKNNPYFWFIDITYQYNDSIAVPSIGAPTLHRVMNDCFCRISLNWPSDL